MEDGRTDLRTHEERDVLEVVTSLGARGVKGGESQWVYFSTASGLYGQTLDQNTGSRRDVVPTVEGLGGTSLYR